MAAIEAEPRKIGLSVVLNPSYQIAAASYLNEEARKDGNPPIILPFLHEFRTLIFSPFITH